MNTTIDLNSDPYLDTGIYKINNCPVTNGPWSDTNTPHWFYLNVAKYDDYNIVQTMNLGYTLYSRIVSKVGNSYPSWVQYASMDQLYSSINTRVQSVNGHAPDANGAVTLPTYSYPTAQAMNTTIDLNSDPYLDMGIYKFGNCTLTNGPYADGNPHWGYLNVIQWDNNIIFQSIFAGNVMYGRQVSKSANSYPAWTQYATTDALNQLSNVQIDARNHTDYRYPTVTSTGITANLNSDPYLDTGIYRLENCALTNSPWNDDPNHRFFIFLKVVKYDDNTIYQSLFFGNQMYGRSVSKSANSYPAWTQYATTDQVNDVSDRLSAVVNNLGMFQRRVDYDTPSGTISNQTVDFNNYQDAGILRVENCVIQNGPYKIGVNVDKDYPHSVFLKVVAFDANTVYQTVYEGDNLYGRKLYNGAGQWHRYTNTAM